MKSISTTSVPICTNSLIIRLGITIQVRIHNFSPTSLIYHHSFHIKSPNSKCDHKGIVMGLESSYFISFGKAQDWRLFASFPLGFLVIFSNRNLWIDAIILDKGPISLFGAKKMTLMVPSDVHVVVSF